MQAAVFYISSREDARPHFHNPRSPEASAIIHCVKDNSASPGTLPFSQKIALRSLGHYPFSQKESLRRLGHYLRLFREPAYQVIFRFLTQNRPVSEL